MKPLYADDPTNPPQTDVQTKTGDSRNEKVEVPQQSDKSPREENPKT